MFRPLSILGILAALGVVVLHYVFCARRAPKPDKSGSEPVQRLSLWERLIVVATFGTGACLAVTGFWAVFAGTGLHGYMLMAHVTFAPPFILSLLAMVITWADDSSFQPHDLVWAKGKGCLCCGSALPAGKFDLAQKVYLWLTAGLGVILTLSAVLCMTPLVGPWGQVLMVKVHKCAALAWVMITIVHVYNRTLARPGQWTVLLTGKVRMNWARQYHSLWADRVQRADPKRTD